MPEKKIMIEHRFTWQELKKKLGIKGEICSCSVPARGDRRLLIIERKKDKDAKANT